MTSFIRLVRLANDISYILGVVIALLTGFLIGALLTGCADTSKTVNVAPPPPITIEGRYLLNWEGQFIAHVEIQGDTLAIDAYPCWTFSGQQEIGGAYEYTDSGRFHFDVKTLDGNTTILIEGAFSGDRFMDNGYYEVRIMGSPCAFGLAVMRPVD